MHETGEEPQPITDTERLDWLAAKEHACFGRDWDNRFAIRLECCGYAEVNKTLRACIDVAIAKDRGINA